MGGSEKAPKGKKFQGRKKEGKRGCLRLLGLFFSTFYISTHQVRRNGERGEGGKDWKGKGRGRSFILAEEEKWKDVSRGGKGGKKIATKKG